MSTSKKPLVDSPFFESTTRRIIPISNWLVSGLITDYNQVINLIVHLGDLLPAGLLATCDSFPDPPQLNTLWASRRQLIQPRSNTGPTLCELPVQDQCFLSTYPPHQKEHTTQKNVSVSLGCGAELALNLVLQAQSSDAIMVLHQQVRLFGDSSPY